MAERFDSFDRPTETRVLAALDRADKDTAQRIRDRMLVFEDLLKLDSAGVQTLMRQVDRDTLGRALKGATEEARDFFLANMSSRAAKNLQEEMETLGPIPIKEADDAQGRMVQVAKALAARARYASRRAGPTRISSGDVTPMSNARKFWFGEDFREPRRTAAEEPARPTRSRRRRPLRQAYESGVAAGRRQAASEDEARLADASRASMAAVPDLSAGSTARSRRPRRTRSPISTRSPASSPGARSRRTRWPPSPMPRSPPSAISAACRTSPSGSPPPQVEEVDASCGGSPGGRFEGRIIVIGDDEMAPGDVRLDWAEGG
jgi:hypothetical protein